MLRYETSHIVYTGCDVSLSLNMTHSQNHFIMCIQANQTAEDEELWFKSIETEIPRWAN